MHTSNKELSVLHVHYVYWPEDQLLRPLVVYVAFFPVGACAVEREVPWVCWRGTSGNENTTCKEQLWREKKDN